ncbi:site-specific integrase [Nonomuraea gerenzanensis]|uniref:Tyr recombinase domain-containing protein n=1 Tax=Nonomuraea gerenzanensis TaxID=93944 RepID=A0A1M4DVP6_9ACTN|nr:hypothetical protein [Nonomuraea gerenzanensis]UBU12974.1 hypothetical protein LCN96_53510 [Nonomuraea gerenzanensis]SBO90611.1 hypothetical protein BN4615_P125 [Nonomuraea gerenzanensis]
MTDASGRRQRLRHSGCPTAGAARQATHDLAQSLEGAPDDRLFALWWLIAPRDLRRAEVAGLRWIDHDTDRRELTITCQLVHTDHRLSHARRRASPAGESAVR